MNTITTAATTYTPPSTSVVHNAQVSLTDRSPASVVHLSQYDTTMPIIAVALTANGQPYTVPSGAAVNVRLAKPDGTFVYNPALGVSGDAQTAYIGTTVQMTTVWGQLNAIVEVVLNGAVAGTGIFILDITANPVPESAIESTDEFLTIQQLAAQVQQAADLVEQNAQNLQTVVDNLEDIQNAAANAQAAAKSAQDAQTAAQQALGFRTFFSAISPDANGNLDPSRPMTTPSAQASWTIESRGDRIQSVQVNGFTQQAGTGDPSPANVRAISTAGLMLTEFVLDGSAVYSDITVNTNTVRFNTQPGALNPVAGSGYCEDLQLVSGNNDDFPHWYPSSANKFLVFFFSIDYFGGKTDKSSIVSALNANPVKCWYQDSSGAGFLYIPQIAQGHEYRCQMMALTAPLCDGDKVESCAPSGCDKRVVFDGSEDEGWIASPVSDGVYRWGINAGGVIPDFPAAANNDQKVGILSNQFVEMTANKTYARTDGVSADSSGNLRVYDSSCFSDLAAWKEKLAAAPLIIWYRSTAYTEQNDIPVQLETHNNAKLTDNGNLSWRTSAGDSAPGSVYVILDINSAGYPMGVGSQGISSIGVKTSNAWGNLASDGSNFFIQNNGVNTSYCARYDEGLDAWTQMLENLRVSGTPLEIVYPLVTPAIYARDPVTLVAVPYTEADAAAANQLANTPSTLPAIDSPDVPMLLDSAEPASTAAPLASTLPVAGTYIVSSQDGTTVLVSLKAMQDGGDASTVGGMTPVQLRQDIDAASLDGQTLEQINAAIAAAYIAKTALIDLVYPVGSIYMSANNVSPQTFLGGTWQQIQGQFLLAASETYPAGSTGGEAAHALTKAEGPIHNHSFGADVLIKQSNSLLGSGDQATLYALNTRNTTANSGEGQPHNNMPPYLAVYMWQRTA